MLVLGVSGATAVAAAPAGAATTPVAHINFQPQDATVPAGYRADYGQGFDAGRGYGWVAQTSPTPVSLVGNGRERGKVADQRLDTLMHMQGTPTAGPSAARWEYALAAGAYDVTVSVGDPSWFDSRHRLSVEGTLAVNNFVPSAATPFRTATVHVQVNDGRLTLDAAGGVNTKLDYIDISSTTPTPIPTPTPTPQHIGDRAGFAGYLGGGDDAYMNRMLDGIKATGAKWVRLGADWSSGEPSKGNYQLADLDRWVAASTARGLSDIVMVGFCPAWAGPNYMGPPNNPADFANFVHTVVAREAPRGAKVYEIWNEPNLQVFWQHPDVAAYTRLLKAAYPAAKSADASVTVVTGGTSPAGDGPTSIAPLTFIKGIYANGGKGFFDAVGHHPYSYPADPIDPQPWNAFITITPQMHQAMVDNGDGNKKIWGTEFGAYTGTGPYSVTEAQQAQTMTHGYQQWVKWPWAAVLFTHTYHDTGTNLADVEQNYGLVHNNWSPKPGLGAFTAAMQLPVS